MNGYPPPSDPPYTPPPYGAPPPSAHAAPAPGGYGIPSAGGFGAPAAGAPYAQGAYPSPQGGYGAPVASRAVPPAASGAPALSWVLLGSFVGALLFGALGGVLANGMAGGSGAQEVVSTCMVLSGLLLVTYGIVTLVWIYKSWQMIPSSMSFTEGGTHVTPGKAIGFLFVPFYNLYWYFIVSAGMCAAYNRLLEGYGSPKRAPRGLAIAACIVQVIPYVNFLLGPFLWLPFVFLVDSAKREYARLAAGSPV